MDEGTTATLTTALDHIIERPRLIRLIEEADAHVTLLVAPGGYGKTTLGRQWSKRWPGPVAWYRTTRASGDVAALAVRLDDLLATVAPHVSRDPSRIGSIASVNPTPAPLARALVSTYASLASDVLLVLDEWESAGTEEADDLVGMLVDELHIRFLITSRSSPGWFTPRMTVYGTAVEVGLEQLAMTEEEALEVLWPLGRDVEREAVLETAQGWPAVLGLAAMSAGRPLPRDTLVPLALYDFLADELLDAAPTEVQEGLLLLAAASVNDSSVAEALLGERAETILADAARRGLLLLDSASVSIHPLLRQLLLTRLHDLEASTAEAMVGRAAVLVEGCRWDEALSVAETIRRRDFVSRALRASVEELLRAGRIDTVRRWVEVGKAVDADRGLVDYADSQLAYRGGSLDLALMTAARAAARLEGDRAARAYMTAARAAHLNSRSERSRKLADQAIAAARSVETKAEALWVRFILAVAEEHDDAAAALDEFEQSAVYTPEQAIRAAQGRLLLSSLEGAVESALEEGEAAYALLESRVDPTVQTSLLTTFADVLCTRGLYERALEATTLQQRLSQEYGLGFVRPYTLMNRTRALIGLRRFAPAERALAELRRGLRTGNDVYVEGLIAILKCMLYLSMGDSERAAAAVLFDVDPRAGRTYRGWHIALRALVNVVSNQMAESQRNATQASLLSRSTEVTTLLATTEAIRSLRDGRVDDATAALEPVLKSCSFEGLVISYRASLDLARHLATLPPHRVEVLRLLSMSNDAALARRLGLDVPRSARRSQQLSPRELEVQELIAQGLTNAEISRLLFISESTTKVHVRHILEKLGVRSRVEAARVWQEDVDD